MDTIVAVGWAEDGGGGVGPGPIGGAPHAAISAPDNAQAEGRQGIGVPRYDLSTSTPAADSDSRISRMT